ncbi:Crp/Fnr family transcriptional regulator [Roseospirillum parvum]|uniref:cAMP-binding domain of CRP or a regulatory subunit of cAMP-dependent protein kinases n=1 Tax=Roseospirillum parvum TaxID=83401 RepID=A0A1G8CXF5_9PROT|nr:Crp/Fnr family transcriptional regulator [Roseospirillum parvum]SDH50135.1 cAMP-binding domain of CRP or a regulatory subunit of cAMP-dependent protein kinases [Roseospirillum parvum]
MKGQRIKAAWRGQADCSGCAIRDLALFADLMEQDFNLIHLPIEEEVLPAGRVIYNAGDPGRALFTVRSGLVKLVQYLADGTQRIVRLLRAGDTVGLEAILSQPYAHTAVVLHPALVCKIPREVVERLSVETPRLHHQLMQRWSEAVNRADRWLTALSTGSARARVARLLLLLAEAAEVGENSAAPPECALFSREDIGAMLGVTTETASRTIAEFRRQGVISENRSNLFACDMEALRAIAGE